MSKLLLFFLFGFSVSTQAAEKVSAYLTTNFLPKTEVSKKLAQAGFQILGEHSVNGNANLSVLLFTDVSLKDKATQPNRGFSAILRVLVNSEKKEIRFSNPNYFLRAFLQKDFDPEIAKSLFQKIEKDFGPLSETQDQLKESKLSGYHFMMGMPYYEDMLEVGKGTSVEISEKIKSKNKLIFELDLGPNSKVIAIALSAQIEGFVDKLKVSENAGLLPYLLLVEDGKAKILHAKYYLAVSLPLLGMGQFMTISDIPGKIEDEVEDLLK